MHYSALLLRAAGGTGIKTSGPDNTVQAMIPEARTIMNRIILTGGGTAGHVTPNLALIPKLLEDGWDIHYVGTEDGIERTLIEPIAGVTYHSVSTGKLRRYFDIKNFTDPFRVLKGIAQASSLVGTLKPSLVFSKGGFVSVPVVYGARMHNVPVLLHESDMTPGLANRITTPFADKLLCTFPEAAKLAGSKGCYTGTPIRPELLHGNRDEGLKLFGFDDGRPVLMVTGGSSGAQAINLVLRKALPRLTEMFQILHLCGKGNLESSLAGNPRYCQREYLNEEMANAFACADVLVSRAGANTLCEILALYKPALLIPYPKGNTSRGDQVDNAESFRKRGLARVLPQDQLTADSLVESVGEVYRDRGLLIDAMEKEPSADGLGNVLKEIAKYKT